MDDSVWQTIRENRELKEENQQLKAEIKKLQEHIKKCDTVERRADELIAQLQKELETAKFEAVKEFAERFKMRVESTRDYIQWLFTLSDKKLDNLLKEMEGT